MRALMSLALSTSIRDMQPACHCSLTTGISASVLSLSARAPSSSISTLTGTLQDKSACARCQAWHSGLLHSFCTRGLGARTCTAYFRSFPGMANIGGREARSLTEYTNKYRVSVPVHECELSMHKRSQPMTLEQLDPSLVAGSSGLLSRSLLSTLPSEDTGVTLRSRFPAAGSEAEYPDAIDGDYSDFGEACGTYRR